MPLCTALLLASLSAAGATVRAASEVIPANAYFMVGLDDLGLQLPSALEALDEALGPSASDGFLSRAPLPALAIGALTAGSSATGIDTDGPLGLFRVASIPAAIGFLGASDAERALQSASEALQAEGASVKASGEALTADFLDGRHFTVVVSGFVLYLVMWDGDPTNGPGASAVLDVLRASARAPLSKTADYQAGRRHLDNAGIELFVRRVGWSQSPLDALSLTVFASPGHVWGEGWVSSRRPLGVPAASPLLRNCAREPAIAFQSALPPDVWAPLVTLAARLTDVDPRSLPGRALDVLSSLESPVGLAFYPNASLIVGGMQSARGDVYPLGSLVMEGKAGSTTYSAAQSFATAQGGVSVRRAGGQTTWTGRIQGQPVRIGLSSEQLHVLAGPHPSIPAPVNVARALQRRFGLAMFAAGHTTLLVDVTRFLSAAREPARVEGLAPGDVRALQRALLWMLHGLDRVDYVLGDLAPEDGGGYLSLELRLHDSAMGLKDSLDDLGGSQ